MDGYNRDMDERSVDNLMKLFSAEKLERYIFKLSKLLIIRLNNVDNTIVLSKNLIVFSVFDFY